MCCMVHVCHVLHLLLAASLLHLQELDGTRMTCQEAELLLGEAECRAAAANASAVAQQDDIMHVSRACMISTALARTCSFNYSRRCYLLWLLVWCVTLATLCRDNLQQDGIIHVNGADSIS